MHHLTLSNAEFEGNNSIYLLGADGPGPLTLVDTGVATEPVRTELEASLAAHGVALEDLEQVLLTHWHHDHAGLAGAIQAASGATVYVHPADAPLVAHDPDALADLTERQTAALGEWGMPPEPRAALRGFLERHDGLRGDGATVTELEDGDTIEAGPFELAVVHLPGHAAGLVGYVFEREGRREAFLGDAVLPKYTPNVGGADIRVEQPLGSYVASLRRTIDLDLDRAWPGHRGPLIDPSGRARDILEHHEQRTARVLSVLRDGGTMTPWAVSATLFGSLENIHILHGPGEAYAHLTHLEAAGMVRRSPDGYQLVGDPTVSEAVASLHP